VRRTGLLSKEYPKQRAKLIDPQGASKSFVAGDPMKFDPQVRQWAYWMANIPDGTRMNKDQEPIINDDDLNASLGLDSAGVSKDTTHMSVADKDGNIFDVTPSGGWIGGAVILGDTGIGMSVRGEQFFWTPREPIRSGRAPRPRYTLTPSIVGDIPMMALGTPGGDNQDQTILQAFLDFQVRLSVRPSGTDRW
jgi:gamma-glutamyltranspeptidase/glutathione hydrolase